MGATADGRKELIAITDGYRESADSWRALLLDAKQRGLTTSPMVAWCRKLQRAHISSTSTAWWRGR